MNRKALQIAIVLASAAAVARAQTDPSQGPEALAAPKKIIGIQDASIYSGYYASGAPTGFEIPMQNPFLGPSVVAGASVSVGGGHDGRFSKFYWSYSPSYFSSVHTTGSYHTGSMGHRASIVWSRSLGSRWTFTATAGGVIANLEQLYFSPTALGTLASMQLTFDNLAAAVLAGKYSDAQVAALLSGAPLQNSAEQGYPYGNRMLSALSSIELTWAKSSRTSVTMTLTGTRSQHLNGAETPGGASVVQVAPQMTTAAAGLTWSYSLSPRTQISIEGYGTRTFSSIQRGYTSRGVVSLGRTMSRRWFVQLRGGGGTLNYSQQAYTMPTTPQYLYGGSIAYKTNAHTFMGLYDRTLGDFYGFGSNATSGATGAWTWRPLGSGWSLSATGGYQELVNPALRNTRSWRIGGGVGRSLTQHTFFSLEYMYLHLPLDLQTTIYNSTQNGFIAAVTWAPSVRR